MSENQELPEENAMEPVKPVDTSQGQTAKPPFDHNQPPYGQFGMPQQNLPNATIALVLGILSIPGCCCYGILGLILGIIAWVLAKTMSRNLIYIQVYIAKVHLKTQKLQRFAV